MRHRDLDLDVIRGVAILLAMGWHFHVSTGNVILDALQAPSRAFGWAGVDLFFVLSGYLVGGIVLREIASTGRFDARRFMIRRVFKLWPVLYLYLAVQVVAREHPIGSFLWQNIAQVQNYTGSSLAQMWSLAIEEHFYLGVALLAPWWAVRSRRPRTAALTLGALIAASFAARVVAVAAGASPEAVHTHTHYRVDALAAGVLLAVVDVHAPDLFTALLRWRLAWWAGVAGGVTWLCLIDRDSTAGMIGGYTVTWLTGVTLILALRRSALMGSAPKVWRPFAFLGVYSYALYIWHALVANVVDRVGALHDHPTGVLAARYGLAILVAVAVTRAVEWPALAARDRLFPRHSLRRPVTAKVPA